MELPIRTNELLSIRSASRNLYDAVGKLQRQEASKFVLLNSKNEMQAVLLTTEAYVELLRGAAINEKPDAREHRAA